MIKLHFSLPFFFLVSNSAFSASISMNPVPNGSLLNEGLIHQNFSSAQPPNGAASHLTQTSSYLSRCFSSFVEEPVAEEASMGLMELMGFPSGQIKELLSIECWPTLGTTSTFFESYAAESVVSAEARRITCSSKDANRLAGLAQNIEGGISIFQSLMSSVRKTMRGSAEDIGWLQKASGMPPVVDETKRFTELLDNIRNGKHKLPNSMVYLLVPGLFSNRGQLYFVSTKTYFSKMGLACHIAKIQSEASVENNARHIKEYIEELYWGSKKRVLLLGHSKGAVDAAAALSMYWPALKDKVAGLVLAQSPYGGSVITSDILREGQIGDYVQWRKLIEFFMRKVIKGDMEAIEDLTYEQRKEFLSKYPMPSELPVVSFHTEARISPSRWSHVTHAELPVLPSLAAVMQPTKVPVVMPFGAVMSACARLLETRYHEKNDGLVTRRDAEVPGSVVVRPDRKIDHMWMAYTTLNDDPSEADASQVCEALLTLLVEVGQNWKHETTMKEE